MDGVVVSGLAVHRSSEMLIVLQHLTASLKSLDYLGIPLAAAYVDMAIHKVVDELEAEPVLAHIYLDSSLDFSVLDMMVDQVFAVLA